MSGNALELRSNSVVGDPADEWRSSRAGGGTEEEVQPVNRSV